MEEKEGNNSNNGIEEKAEVKAGMENEENSSNSSNSSSSSSSSNGIEEAGGNMNGGNELGQDLAAEARRIRRAKARRNVPRTMKVNYGRNGAALNNANPDIQKARKKKQHKVEEVLRTVSSVTVPSYERMEECLGGGKEERTSPITHSPVSPLPKTTSFSPISLPSVLSERDLLKTSGGKDGIDVARDIEMALFTPRDEYNGLTGIQQYIYNYVSDAVNDPGSRAAQCFANVMFSEKLLSKVLNICGGGMDRRQEYEYGQWQLRKTLFDRQKEVFDDETSKRIMVICSRRAGKTELNARLLVKSLMRDNSPCLYLNKTFKNAVNQMYNLVIDLLHATSLTITSESKVEGYIELGNGSKLNFGGVNDVASIDKLRGYKYRTVIVDEVGHIKNGGYLVDEVLTPLTMDYPDSQMLFSGTPPRTKNYAVSLWDSNIKKYHWTMMDNPFISDPESFIQSVCDEKGIGKDDPFIRREYYGDMHAYDMDAVIYKGYKTWQEGEFTSNSFYPTECVIGVDFGYVDYNGIVLVACDHVSKQNYVIREWKFNKAGVEDIIACCISAHREAMEFMASHGWGGDDEGNMLGRITFVTDTNMPPLCEDLYNKYGYNVVKASKQDKAGSIERLGAMMRTGQLKIPKGGICQDECDKAMWKRDEETDVIVPEVDDELFHPDIMDALRYASTYIFDKQGSITSRASHNIPMKDHLPPSIQSLNDLNEALVSHQTTPPWVKKMEEGDHFIV